MKPWLETIEPAYKNRASLIQAIKSDSAQASSAMDDLMDIRILDVDHALRGATRSHKAELRAKAC